MTVDFNDYFWGEKNNGFDVLYHNMKYGLVASKELSEFLRERSSIEENSSKLMSKLSKQASGGCVHGTFAPFWEVVKTSVDRLATLHMQMVHKVSELVKDINKYAEELHKKHKSVKEDESGTLEAVQAIQSTTLQVQKAKDLYNQKSIEVDKLRKESTSPKDIEKAEAKLKKAHEEYKVFVDKYSVVKKDFEDKMSITCRHFQEIEEAHLMQMKDFLTTYAEVVQTNHDLVGQVHSEFKRRCLEMTVDKLLERFVLSKSTGLEKPGNIEFEDMMPVGEWKGSQQDVNRDKGPVSQSAPGGDASNKPWKKEGNAGITNKRRTTSLLNLFTSNSQDRGRGCPSSAPSSPSLPAAQTLAQSKTEASIARNPLRGSKWFLRSRRDKAKLKKVKKKKDGSDQGSNKEDKSDVDEKIEPKKCPLAEAENETPEIDEDGFMVRPKSSQPWPNDKSSFYSTSDSDTDDEHERKLRVEIKPLKNGSAPISASVDELRATMENLSLSPISALVSPDMVSSASTPTGCHPYGPLQSPTPSSSSRHADLGEMLSESDELPKPPAGVPSAPSAVSAPTPLAGLPLAGGRQAQTPTLASYMSIPRPASRRADAANPRGRHSPLTISRADSVASLEFRTASGVSRGPSPLTIGMADTIPLAVAFHEIIHSYFRGSDESKCQVKMSGDMMLSFPAGIVAVLANNPNPAKLAFRISNSQRLNNVIPNKQLINVCSMCLGEKCLASEYYARAKSLENAESLDSNKTNNDSIALEFNMSALSVLLKQQSEQNPTASYFNVDILKYQISPQPGANSCPFQLVSYWKCEQNFTDLLIDYKYNSHAMNQPSPLLNVTVTVHVDGGVKSHYSKPTSQWLPDSTKAVWKFTELSQYSENNGVGSIRAKFDVDDGPSVPSLISAQFNCEGTTLSGLDFQLIGPGYRLSLVKRRFVSGKYICEGESKPKQRHSSNTSTPSTVTGGSEC